MKPSSPNVPDLTVKVSAELNLNCEQNGKLSQNTILLLQCLTSLNTLATNTPEGLQEAAEALESMVEFYKERTDS